MPADLLVSTDPGETFAPIKADLEVLLPMVDLPSFAPPDDE